MRKLAFLLSVFSFFFFSLDAQYADFGTGLEPPECDSAELNFFNWSDTVGLLNPSWEWDVEGQYFSDWEPAPMWIYPGVTTVTLYLYQDGVEYDSYSMDIEIMGFQSFTVSSGGEACVGEDLQFWVDDDLWWNSILWTFGDNSVTEFSHRDNWATHKYFEDGIYDVTVIVDHMCGIDTVVQQVTIGGAAKPEISGYITNGPDFCPGDPVSFDCDGEYNSYHWEFGDGYGSDERRPQHIYPADDAQTYAATVTVTNSCGNSSTDTVWVNFADSLEAYAGFDYYFDGRSFNPCPGTPVEFNAWGAGAYEWDFGDGSMSNEQKPVNYFTEPGPYFITLTVWNGCGDVDFNMDSIFVSFDPADRPYTDFYVKLENRQMEQNWSDTIVICPGSTVDFRNATWSDSEASIAFEWHLGDGTIDHSKHVMHRYDVPGGYDVMLVAYSSCGGSDTLWKHILVDNSIMPEFSPGVTPLVICSGEEVFFFLNQGIERKDYTYDIDFGDGQTINNITGYQDSVLQTLANHVYIGTPGQEFNFVFSATNSCGNTFDFNGTVTITNDNTLKPFYYISNTTSMQQGTQMMDWSKRRSPDDHEMLIHIVWPDWPGGQDNFAVFFWYEGFWPDQGEIGPANGYVEFRSSDIMVGDSIRAFVPIDPAYAPQVGFAAGWSCDGNYEQGREPEVWGMQMYYPGGQVNTVPIMPGGYTDMVTIGPPVVIDGSGMWDGLCAGQRPEGDYFYQLNAGQYIQLSLDKETNEYWMDATADPDGHEHITSISWGDYAIVGIDSIEFTDWGDCSGMNGIYRFVINGDELDFIPVYDLCVQRAMYLTDSTYIRKPDFGHSMMNMAACPNDKVQFTIAGGLSYQWNFGDGSPVSIERYPVHMYTLPGDYDAYVIATNACGRTDTVHTPVTIRADNPPFAGFWWEEGDFERFEPIQFRYDEYLDQAGNNTYLWDFGDNTTSDLPNPKHAYQRTGDYTISLTVTNGCGSSTETSMIWIKDAELACEAKIHIDSIVGNTVYFRDISRGEVDKWFWDFGDGFTSSQKDPVYTYEHEGFFWVCLAIYDSLNDCSHQVCRQIEIGTQLCMADFTYRINPTTSKVQFFDRSTNATEWFWDFGDGTFSDLQEPEHVYNEPGWYEVCLSIYNESNDCFDFRCYELQVGEEDPTFCFADFGYFIDEATNTVSFTDESSESATNLYWTFGDGTYTEERNPVKSYMAPGVYEVCLIVFDIETGCTDEICKEIPVGISDCNLRAGFAFFIDIENDVVNFSDRSGGKVSNYFWDFGDGGTSSAKDPRHVYEEPGFYLVILSIWNEENGCSDHIAEFIQIGEPDCRAAFEYKVDAAQNSVQFSNLSKGTLADYFWDFDDGTFSDEESPQHQYEVPGLYFVSLTVITGDGLCMDFLIEPIQVGTVDCAAKFTYFIDSTNNVAHFTPEAIGSATDYLWFFGDGAISTEKVTTHVFTQPGYFTVGLNTFDEASGCMDYWEEVILIGRAGEDCRAGFSYVSDPDNKQVKFGDRSKGKIIDWVWDFGDGSYGFEQNPVHTYPVGGYYMVCLTVVNEFNIPNTFCDFIQLAALDAERCFADFIYTVDSTSKTVKFEQISHGDPDEFMWFFGDDETSSLENPSHTYSEAGYYLVELSIANSSTNCTSNGFELINVASGNRGLRADFSYRYDSSNLKADTYPVDFVGTTLGDAGKLKWDFGDGTTDTTTLNPTHVYLVPGVYTACLTVTNPITGDSSHTCQQVITHGYQGETYYADTDGDGYGDPNASTTAYDHPEGYVENDLDCDDTDKDVTTGEIWYLDGDNDGFGNPNDSTVACTAPTGYTDNNEDLDDSNAEIKNSIGQLKGWNTGLGIYPNPFDRTAYIVYELPADTWVDLVIFDQTGRMIDRLVHGDQTAGKYRIEYDGAWLDGGIYTLRLATKRSVSTARMVIE